MRVFLHWKKLSTPGITGIFGAGIIQEKSCAAGFTTNLMSVYCRPFMVLPRLKNLRLWHLTGSQINHSAKGHLSIGAGFTGK